jgi:hypothetical protein
MTARRFVKWAVVRLALWGFLPWPWADAILKRWRLGAL